MMSSLNLNVRGNFYLREFNLVGFMQRTMMRNFMPIHSKQVCKQLLRHHIPLIPTFELFKSLYGTTGTFHFSGEAISTFFAIYSLFTHFLFGSNEFQIRPDIFRQLPPLASSIRHTPFTSVSRQPTSCHDDNDVTFAHTSCKSSVDILRAEQAVNSTQFRPAVQRTLFSCFT